jgi:hypothetical protein
MQQTLIRENDFKRSNLKAMFFFVGPRNRRFSTVVRTDKTFKILKKRTRIKINQRMINYRREQTEKYISYLFSNYYDVEHNLENYENIVKILRYHKKKSLHNTFEFQLLNLWKEIEKLFRFTLSVLSVWKKLNEEKIELDQVQFKIFHSSVSLLFNSIYGFVFKNDSNVLKHIYIIYISMLSLNVRESSYLKSDTFLKSFLYLKYIHNSNFSKQFFNKFK